MTGLRIVAFTTLLMLCLCGFSLAETIEEESSHTEFPTMITAPGESGVELQAVGTGIRKKAWFKVYAACFYVDATVDLGADPWDRAINGEFAKLISMHMLRDVDGEKIGGAYREGIRKTLPEGHDEAIDKLVGMYTEKAVNGQDLVLYYEPGKGLRASQGGKELGWIADTEVITALWAIWFGEEPISDDLRKGLLNLDD
ncbi:MAG: hypothetical protein GY835_26415 [bacterium]|nr:hypothetical protein [bacterium]